MVNKNIIGVSTDILSSLIRAVQTPVISLLAPAVETLAPAKEILRKFHILKWKQKKENFQIYFHPFNVSSVVSCKM